MPIILHFIAPLPCSVIQSAERFSHPFLLVCLMPPPVDSINLVSLESEGEEKRGRKGGRLTARGPKRVIHRANPNPQGGIEGEIKI